MSRPALRHLLSRQVTDGPHESPEFLDSGIPFLSVDNVIGGALQFSNCRYISLEEHRRFSRKVRPQKGDVLITKAASVGRVACVEDDRDFNVWSPIAVLRPRPEQLSQRFLFHYLQSLDAQAQLEKWSTSNTQQNIAMGDIASLNVPLPPLEQQRAIADHLDAETARIDALIAKKQQLIHLLEEHRQGSIDELVANPSFKLTAVRRLQSHLTSGPRGWAEYASDTGRPFLRITNIDRRWISLDMTNTLMVDAPATAEARRTQVQTGDVLVSITADIGSVGIVSPDLHGAAMSQHVALVRPSGVEPEWLAYAIKTTEAQVQLDSGQYGGTKTQLGLDDVASLRIRLPDAPTQQHLLSILKTRLEKVASLQSKLAAQIDLLAERRQALITAAVTGELTVPGVG